MLEPTTILITAVTVALVILTCLKTTRKFIFGIIAVALFVVVACAAQDAARADTLQDDVYYRVVFIDTIEDAEADSTIHTDDLKNIWDFYEDYSDIEFTTNENLNALAKSFAKVNTLWFAEETTNPVIVGRIVVLTMWEANANNPVDEEVLDVYYSKYVTNVR